MEDYQEEDVFELPPGFRFHPTDEELITHYLSPKVLDNRFRARAIGEVDLNRVEPWELPGRAKMGEKEWYFFCVRDRKYPTGLRTNRATDAGYWKATGKDKDIYRMKALVGMKKTLVFYTGRAPKGIKSNWVMHEYRLEGVSSRNFHQYSKNEWVICRVFSKTAGGKSDEILGLIRPNELPNPALVLPPLTDSSPNNCNSDTTTAGGASHVTCFSDMIEDATTAKTTRREDFRASNVIVGAQNSEYPGCFVHEEHHQEPILRMLMQSYRMNRLKPEIDPALSYFDGSNYHQQHQQLDLDCFWQY